MKFRFRNLIGAVKFRPLRIKIMITIKQAIRNFQRVFGMSKTELDIVDRVSGDYGVPKEIILSPRRQKEFVDLRCIIAYVLRKREYSLPEIGRVLNRDHTTVINLLKRIEKDLELKSRAEKYWG